MPKDNPAAYGDMNTLLDQLIANGYFEGEQGASPMRFAEGEFLRREAQQQGARNAQPQASRGQNASAPTPPRRPATVGKKNNTGVDLNDPGLYVEGTPSGSVQNPIGYDFQPVGTRGQNAPTDMAQGAVEGATGGNVNTFVPSSAVANSGMRVGPASANASQALPDGTRLNDPTAPVAGSFRNMIESVIRGLAAQSPMPPQMQGEGKLIDDEQIVGNVPITREDDVAQRNPVSRNMQAGIDAKAKAKGLTPPPANAGWAEQLRYNMRVMNSGKGDKGAKPATR